MDTDEGLNKDFTRLHLRRTPTTGGNDFGCGLAPSRSTEKTGSPRSLRGKSRGYTDTGRLIEKLESGTGERPSRSTEKSGSPKPSIRRTSLQGNSGVEEPGAVRLTGKAGRDPLPRAGNPPNTSPPGQNALGRPHGAAPEGTPWGPLSGQAQRAWTQPGLETRPTPLPQGKCSGETPRGRLREQPRAGNPSGQAHKAPPCGRPLGAGSESIPLRETLGDASEQPRGEPRLGMVWSVPRRGEEGNLGKNQYSKWRRLINIQNGVPVIIQNGGG